MNLRYLALGACAAAVLSLPAYSSSVLFDNADPPLYVTSRVSSLEGAAAYLQIGSSNVTINQIGINAEPLQDGQLKFAVFSDSAPPGGTSGALLFSDTVNVTKSNSLSYILSDPLSFTLLAGQYYDIGAVFSGSAIDYTYDFTSDTQSGITSIASSQNLTNFASPVQAGHGGVSDIDIQLYGPTVVTPDPATAALGLIGLGCILMIGCLQRGALGFR